MTLTLDEVRNAIGREGANWVAGPTPLSHMPLQEKLRYLGAEPGPNEPSLAEREQMALRNLVSPGIGTPTPRNLLPSMHDLRNVDGRNFITPVRDQGACGSCVAFATVAAVEGSLKLSLNDPDLDVNCSEAHLFYCHARAEGRRCESGWWADRALEAFKTSGVADEGCYPYRPGDQACNNLCANAPARLTFITNWRRYVTADSMKNWLTSTGPLIACFTVYGDFQDFYTGGVYKHVTGEYRGGHCVCVVGYDDDQQCWICKNSWGPRAQENGFFRIAYGNCGIDAEMWAVEGVRIPSAVREAVFVSQSLPAAVVAGQSYNVEVTMRNVGIQTWTPQRKYRLGAQNPQDNNTWGLSWVNVPGPIRPWQDATFRFQVIAPSIMPAHFQWRMLQEGVEWFGNYTPDVVLAVVGTPVHHGATLKLRHVVTGCSLHSHPFVYSHPGSSRQQQVTCFAGADDNDLWRIKGPDGQPEEFRSRQPVQHGDIIRIEHVLTGANLHSHAGFPSPVTHQQEVTCFGQAGIGDGNDDWRVEVNGGGQWNADKQLRLIHVATNVALHSHGGFSDRSWTMGQQEVTGFAGRDENDFWSASDLQALIPPNPASFLDVLLLS